MKWTRREALQRAGMAGAAGLGGAVGLGFAAASARSESRPVAHKFLYSLNTSTIRGQKLTLVEEIDIAAKAGYDAIEPWISELDDYVKSGGSLRDLAARLRDHKLSVESSIGFFEWIVDDDAKRNHALEEAKRNFDLLAQIGGKRLAAPPVGATDRADVSLQKAAERYRALLELGAKFGVTPQAEIWCSPKRSPS